MFVLPIIFDQGLSVLENETRSTTNQLAGDGGTFEQQWKSDFNKGPHATVHSPRPLPHWMTVEALKCLSVICNRKSIGSNQGRGRPS